MTLVECATLMRITPSRTLLSRGGAKGIRTPDLLVAKVSSAGDEVDVPRESPDEPEMDDA